MYTFFKRTAPDPNLLTFDCPDSNLTVISRSSSNTPLMALATLQNEVFHEAAQTFTKNLLENPALQTDLERLTQAFRACLARFPEEDELVTLIGLLKDNREYYRDDKESALKLAPLQTSRSGRGRRMGRHRPDYHQPRRVYRPQLGMHPIEEYQQLTRRHFLTSAAGGIGGTALASMLGSDLTSPMAPKLSQFAP
jgi:hypothetical protein